MDFSCLTAPLQRQPEPCGNGQFYSPLFPFPLNYTLFSNYSIVVLTILGIHFVYFLK